MVPSLDKVSVLPNEKGLAIVSPTLFVFHLSRRVFLMLYSIN